MLPGMDGYEVCRLMQRDSRLNHIPVIMLTARSAVPNKGMGYERGDDDYVIKPFDPDELSVRVRAQLHHLYHDRVSELTGLPGSQSVEDRIRARTTNGSQPWAIVYVDIDNFTVYNETYSYLEGDELLKMAGHALAAAVAKAGGEGDFVGHVGGDQFAVLTEPQRVEAITSTAEDLFNQESGDFYSSTDLDQGYMVNINHQGLLTRANLCKLKFD